MIQNAPIGLKLFFAFQVILFAGTVIGYGSTELAFGLLGQLFLGITQVSSAFIFFLLKKRLTTSSKKQMQNYGIIVVLYLVIAIIIANLRNKDVFDADIINIIGGVIVPLVIAVYYMTILNRLKFLPILKKKKETYNPDILDN